MVGPDWPWIAAVKRAVRSLALIVSMVTLTPVCLAQSSPCCLKNGSAVGMKWFHCSSETVAPEMLAGAAVGLAGAAAVGCAPAAGAVVGLAAGGVVGAAGGGCDALGPHAEASRTALLPSAPFKNSRRFFMTPPDGLDLRGQVVFVDAVSGKDTLALVHVVDLAAQFGQSTGAGTPVSSRQGSPSSPRHAGDRAHWTECTGDPV